MKAKNTTHVRNCRPCEARKDIILVASRQYGDNLAPVSSSAQDVCHILVQFVRDMDSRAQQVLILHCRGHGTPVGALWSLVRPSSDVATWFVVEVIIGYCDYFCECYVIRRL